jgi:hypothetical protein
MKAAPDTSLRGLRVREAVSAELASWDRATERRADAEYALEQFEEAGQRDLSPEEFERRREVLQEEIHKAKRKEEEAKRTCKRAMERAERRIPR